MTPDQHKTEEMRHMADKLTESPPKLEQFCGPLKRNPLIPIVNRGTIAFLTTWKGSEFSAYPSLREDHLKRPVAFYFGLSGVYRTNADLSLVEDILVPISTENIRAYIDHVGWWFPLAFVFRPVFWLEWLWRIHENDRLKRERSLQDEYFMGDDPEHWGV